MLHRSFLKLLPIGFLSISPMLGPMAMAQSSPPLAAPNAVVPNPVAPSSVAEDFQKAEAAMQNRQYREAEALWRSIIQRDPKNAKAYLRLGDLIQSLMAISHPPAAKQAYQQAVALDPTDPEAYLALGPFLSFDRDNEASEQVKFYRQAIQVARPHAEIYYRLGIELSNQYGNRVITTAQQDEAIAAFRKSIELDPKQGEVYVVLGKFLWERGDRDAGKAVLQAGMKLNYMDAYRAYSKALSRQNRLSEMVPIYQNAIQADPNHPNRLELTSNLGQLLEQLNRFKEAETLYLQTTVVNPTTNIDFMYGSAAFNGRLSRLKGKLDWAEVYLRRSINGHPDFAYAHGELGRVLQQQGKLEAAAAAYRQARSLSGDPSYMQDELSQVEALLKVKP